MDLSPLESLMGKLADWRICEAAAAQDVRDAQAHVAAADLRLSDAKERQRVTKAHVEAVEKQLASLIIDQTEPPALIFTQGE